MEDEMKKLEAEVAKLKRLRAEDAKANEKVVSIFATQEHSWIDERRKLKLQIRALLAQFHIIELKKDAEIASLNSDLEEKDRTIRNRDEELVEQSKKEENLEEKVRIAEEENEELKKKLQIEAQEHSEELLKHKTTFIELASTHRQLEAEMDRVTREAKVVKSELDEEVTRKDAAEATVRELSEEVEKMRNDVEQKDKILSAMLRKSKTDTTEKQVLVKEVKALKAKKKQAEMEAERWRIVMEAKRRKAGRVGHSAEAECSHDRRGEARCGRSEIRPRIRLLEYLDAESRNGRDCDSSEDDNASSIVKHFHRTVGKRNEELIMTDIRHLQEWVQKETEKYTTALEQRHHDEIEAFAEQMRVRDQKTEVLRWQFLTTELEMKQLQSHIEGLDGSLSKIREENVRLETLLMDKEKELKSVKDRFSLHMINCKKNTKDLIAEPNARRRSKEREQETCIDLVKDFQKFEKKVQSREGIHDKMIQEANPEVKQINLDSKGENYLQKITVPTKTVTSVNVSRRPSFEGVDIISQDSTKDITESDRVGGDEIEEEKVVIVDRGHSQYKHQHGIEVVSKSSTLKQEAQSTWKMDMQAMGVSYKIKRLKQQLVVLEKYAGKDSSQKSDCNDKRKTDEKRRQPLKGFQLLMSLLNKQVKRYECLEEKINILCIKMHGSDQDRRGKDCDGKAAKEETERLELLLEETFQLQRYMVATGQKLLDIQSRITCSFINGDNKFEECAGFNMGQFADIVRSLFRDIQRGMEMRIARIIGNLEGTLAREGILHMGS